MAQNPFEKALVDEGLVGTPLESLARSIYMQESGAGKNTKTSNAGAVGGMQILPSTFNAVLPGGDINNPYDNSRAGLRYIKQMYNQSGGDLNLTAVGYYGGPGGMQKAKQGVAVSDPRNPNAPTTLEYAKQVLSRTDSKDSKNVSRETLKPEKVIAEAGQGYQAAYALMSMADEEPENEREIAAREAQEEQSAAQQFANIQKQLASVRPATPFAAQGSEEVQQFSKGGEAQIDDDEAETAKRDFQMFLKKATREESPLDVKFMTPDPRPMVQEGLGVVPAAPASVMGRVGYQGDNFRAGASGIAAKTPQGVKVMPGMYDIGYKMPMAGGELDMSYSRGIKSMPGMPTPQMANVRYVRKFEKGGEAQADAQGSAGGFERWVATKMGVDKAWDKSLDAPYEMGLSEDSGTRGDAVRHMVLMREIEKKYNPTVAKTLGYAHEFIGGPMQYFSQGNAQSSRDREMDLRNNALGLELSKQAGADDAKFKELMRQALENKQADFYREEYTGKRKAPGATQVRKRAEGSPEMGEVSGRTFEEGGPETAKKMLKDAVRGVQFYPYDLVGAPVDIINMGLKGVDYFTGSKLATDKPVGGSEYLIEKANKAGIAQKPTGSAAEDLARLGSAFINPASGARATGRVLGKAGQLGKDVLEDLSMATTGQGGSKMAQLVTSQAQPAFAVRPKGGVYLGARSANEAPLTRIDDDILEAIENVDESTDQGKAIVEFIDKKVRKYHQVDRGTPNDPIFKGILEGRIDSPGLSQELIQRAREGDMKAYAELRNMYDMNLGMKTLFPSAALKDTGKYAFERMDEIKNQFKEAVQKQKPGEPTASMDIGYLDAGDAAKWPGLYDWPGLNQMVKESESSKLMALLNKTDLPPHLRQAAREAEPVTYSWYGETDINQLPGLVDIKDYLSTRTPAEIKNMGYADVVAKTQEWHTMLEQARKDPSKFSKKQLTQGTELLMPAKDDMKWLDVKSSDALSLEGNIMGHCVGGSNYCSAVNEGTKKIVSLRDKKGIPHVTIELASDSKNGVFDRVVQVKGTANREPVKYFPQIDEFLKEYQSKLGDTKLRITEMDRFLPEAWREQGVLNADFRRVDDRGAWVRYQNPQGEVIEEYVLRGDPRFQELGFPDAD
jgi:SLT domain-containing protein